MELVGDDQDTEVGRGQRFGPRCRPGSGEPVTIYNGLSQETVEDGL